jgi:hypothetical protein
VDDELAGEVAVVAAIDGLRISAEVSVTTNGGSNHRFRLNGSPGSA